MTSDIISIKELEKLKAAIKLLANIEEGEKAAKEKGWLSADDVEAILVLCLIILHKH